MANFISSILRLIWLGLENQEQLIENLTSQFFNNDPTMCSIGLIIYNFMLKNLKLNPHSFGYFKYRRLSLSFQEKALNTMFNATMTVVKGLTNLAHNKSNDFNEEIYNLSLEVLFQLMTYNFNLSYFDFSSDKDLGEISTTVYPDEWKGNLVNYEFWESLIGILKLKIMDDEVDEWVRLVSTPIYR